MGHLRQPRKGIRSTKVLDHVPDRLSDPDQFPPSSHSIRTDDVYLKVVDLEGKIYTDQTGRFPVTSSKGNKYILVAYHHDSNTIHVEPLKTRQGSELRDKYQKIHRLLSARGLQPRLHILNNECPDILKQYMDKVNEKWQLVPPHVHRQNAAERAIYVFKEHFIAG